jgi:hypothetical protein
VSFAYGIQPQGRRVCVSVRRFRADRANPCFHAAAAVATTATTAAIVRAFVRSCVRAFVFFCFCVFAFVRSCVRACVYACVGVCMRALVGACVGGAQGNIFSGGSNNTEDRHPERGSKFLELLSQIKREQGHGSISHSLSIVSVIAIAHITCSLACRYVHCISWYLFLLCPYPYPHT